MRLSITTPQGSVVEADVDEVSAPGVLGELGILPGHVPLMTALKPGVLVYRAGERVATLAVGEGFLQVAPAAVTAAAVVGSGAGGIGAIAGAITGDRVLVLVDQALAARSVDRAAAEKDFARAEAELAAWKRDLDGAYQALVVRRDWALARMHAAGRL
jgi:F-type H+-transporting ATPase subunit epsilon